MSTYSFTLQAYLFTPVLDHPPYLGAVQLSIGAIIGKLGTKTVEYKIATSLRFLQLQRLVGLKKILLK